MIWQCGALFVSVSDTDCSCRFFVLCTIHVLFFSLNNSYLVSIYRILDSYKGIISSKSGFISIWIILLTREDCRDLKISIMRYIQVILQVYGYREIKLLVLHYNTRFCWNKGHPMANFIHTVSIYIPEPTSCMIGCSLPFPESIFVYGRREVKPEYQFKDTCYTWGQISVKFVNMRRIKNLNVPFFNNGPQLRKVDSKLKSDSWWESWNWKWHLLHI